MDKDSLAQKKLGQCHLTCGVMLDSRRLLIGLSSDSAFFYILIDDEDNFNFAPCILTNFEKITSVPIHKPVSKLILQDDSVYALNNRNIYKIPRNMIVLFERKIDLNRPIYKLQHQLYGDLSDYTVFNMTGTNSFVRVQDRVQIVYHNFNVKPIDFQVSACGRYIATILALGHLNISDITTGEVVSKILLFSGQRVLVPDYFSIPDNPCVISFNSKGDVLCTDLFKSLSQVNCRTGTTPLKVKSKQEEYPHEGTRFYGIMDDNRSIFCLDEETNQFALARFVILRTL